MNKFMKTAYFPAIACRSLWFDSFISV